MSDRDSANEVLRAAVFSAFCAGIEAYRQHSNGVPNVMLRDISAIHGNTAFSDLPDVVQKALRDSTDQAFRKLLQSGYTVAPKADVKPVKRSVAPVSVGKPKATRGPLK